MMNRGGGCSNCGVNFGWIHPEECIGCNGGRSANHDYYPDVYDYDGSQKPEAISKIKALKKKLGIKW